MEMEKRDRTRDTNHLGAARESDPRNANGRCCPNRRREGHRDDDRTLRGLGPLGEDRLEWNPQGIPERTVTQARVVEFGPCTFGAYKDATAGLRSLTDEFLDLR
jgi:hypothetical protein